VSRTPCQEEKSKKRMRRPDLLLDLAILTAGEGRRDPFFLSQAS
jgi:hypothetical protein